MNGIAEGKPASTRKIFERFFLSACVSLLLQAAATAAAAVRSLRMACVGQLANYHKNRQIIIKKEIYDLCAISVELWFFMASTSVNSIVRMRRCSQREMKIEWRKGERHANCAPNG